MSNGLTRYWPGVHSGIRHGDTTLLAAVVPGDEASLDLLEVMAGGGGADAVLDALFRRGFGAAPDFVLVEQGPAQGRVLARGEGRAVLADGTIVTGAGVFADQRVDTVEGAVLSLGEEPAGPSIPAGEGLVPANGWSLGLRGPAVSPVADPPPALDASADAPPHASPTRDSETPPTLVDPRPLGPVGAALPAGPGEDEADLSTYLDLLSPPANGSAGPDLSEPRLATPHPPSPPAHAPRLEEPAPAPFMSESPSPAVEQQPPPAPGSAFIDSVPFLDLPASDHEQPRPPAGAVTPPASDPPLPSQSSPEPATSARPGMPPGEVPAPAENGRTVSRAEIRRQAAATQQTVVARRCASGHLTQAYLPTCRVCGGAVPEQPDVTVLRPPLGRLVLPDGQSYLLDRPVVLGRDPREPDRPVDGIPHLVKIVDPRSEVSSQHALVTLDFWAIEVTDLGSTNGTEVVTPDGRRRRLVSGEPVQVEPGAVLVLAEVLEIRVEVAP